MRKCMVSGLLVIFILAACGAAYDEGDAMKSSISLSADGSVDLVLRESFDKDYYSEDELVAYTEECIKEYNEGAGSEAIVLTAHQAQSGIAALAIHFATAEDYDAFMGSGLYLGTLQGAYERGESFDVALSYAKKPEHIIGKNDLMNMAGERVLIFEGDMSVSLPEAPEYYTFGMQRTGEKKLEAAGDGTYFIIY